MARKALLLALFVPLLLAESFYFSRQCGAGIMRLMGERVLYRNDHQKAWRDYQRALRWGGDAERLETDMIELLLFGLEQVETGFKIDTPVAPAQAVALAQELIARRIREHPYGAYNWSLASDVYIHLARQRRRESPLDLSGLSEDPLENLTAEDWLGIHALEVAARLEPNNFLYHDLLTEMFLEVGSVARAAEHCTRAVASYAVLAEHPYLARPDLDLDLLEAALRGFEQGLAETSMIPRPAIECDAGILLVRHGQPRRAMPYLARAIEQAPDFYEGHYYLAVAHYGLEEFREAIPHFERASKALPDEASPHFYLGLCHAALGDLEAAAGEFRSAKEKAPREITFFHKLGEMLEATGKIKEAETQFVAAAHLNPDRSIAWTSLLAFYLRHDDVRSASEICSRLGVMAPEDSFFKDQCASLGSEIP
jgi:tetratricopeptide (TPR) repeat protein